MKKINRFHFKTIGSTNTWAKEQASQFDLDALTLITADRQTAGRGRFKRRWESPAGLNIYATFCFFIDLSRSDIGHVPQTLALSALEVIQSLHMQATLKWPNDVLINGKKVAGILCETVMAQGKRCVVCGIGLNVNMPVNQLSKIDRPATSLLVESHCRYNVQLVLDLLVKQFNHNLTRFLSANFDCFFEKFNYYSYLVPGQEVRFHDNQTLLTGTFLQLNREGSITIKLNNGEIKDFYTGEFL